MIPFLYQAGTYICERLLCSAPYKGALIIFNQKECTSDPLVQKFQYIIDSIAIHTCIPSSNVAKSVCESVRR